MYLKNNGDYWAVYNLSIDGDTSSWLLERFETECKARQSNVIIFAIGSNDCTIIDNKDHHVPLELFQKNITSLYQAAKKFTDKIVFVGQTICDESKTNPLPWVPEMSQTMKDTIVYDDATKQFCSQEHVPFIDMMDILSPEDLQDGIHPTAQGHEKMYIRIRDFLIEKKFI